MSQAVRGGDLVLVSGQVALDSNGDLVGPARPEVLLEVEAVAAVS